MMSFRNHLMVISMLLLVLVVYLISMPGSITLEDAGLFQMICHQGGIGHPPGYPLFILGCQAFVSLPGLGDGVFAGNLLSALLALASAAALYGVCRQLHIDPVLSLLSAAAYAFSQTFWSQAIIIEVYSLACLMFLLCLLLALRYRQGGGFRDLLLLTFCFSLALANHWPLQLLSAPALVLVVWPRLMAWQTLIAEVLTLPRLAMLIVVFAAGLLPYLSLLQADPEVAVFGPVSGVDEMVRYVSRSLYNDHFEMAGWDDRWQFQTWVWYQSLQEYSVWLAPVIAVGIVRSFYRFDTSIALALVLLYLGSTTLLILLLGFEFTSLRQAIFKPYPVIAYASLAIWLVTGTEYLLRRPSLPPWLPRVVPVLMVVVILLSGARYNYKGHSTLAENYGRLVLASVPENAILFVEGDNGAGLMGYLHHVESVRPDLELRNWDNLVFRNRLVSPLSPDAVQSQARSRLLETTDRPVYSTLRQEVPSVNRGLVFELGDRAGFACDRSNHTLAHQLVALDQQQLLTDGHEKHLLFGMLMDLTRLHVGLMFYAGLTDQEELDVLLALQRTFAGKLASLETLVTADTGTAGKEELARMAQAAQDEMPQGLAASTRALLSEYEGRIALMNPADPDLAAAHFRRSVNIYPVKQNRSVCELYRLGDDPARRQLRQQIPGIDCD